MRENQKENRKLCGSCYCTDYLDYIYVNEIGEIIKPDYLTTHFKAFLEEHNMPHIRFHDLRHPYVKHTTKIFPAKAEIPNHQIYCDGLGFRLFQLLNGSRLSIEQVLDFISNLDALIREYIDLFN